MVKCVCVNMYACTQLSTHIFLFVHGDLSLVLSQHLGETLSCRRGLSFFIFFLK